MATSTDRNLRWERGLADAAKYLPTFRLLNIFSSQLSHAWSRLRGGVDFSDLIYAETTRLVEPVAYQHLFSPGAAAHMLLPESYDNQLYALDLAFNENDRLAQRALIFSRILAKSENRVWVARVMEEVFGARAAMGSNDDDLIKQVAAPSDGDRRDHRLRHPAILFDYYQLSNLSQSENGKFKKYFETLTPEFVAVEFARHIKELLELYREGKTARLENFIFDVFVREKKLMIAQPAKVEAMILALAVLTHQLRPAGNVMLREETLISKMIWLLIAMLPEELTLNQISTVVRHAALGLLPEIHFPFRFGNEGHRLPEYFLGLMNQSRINNLLAMGDAARKIFSSAFAEKLLDDSSFENLVYSPNSNWIFLWFVGIAENKESAQGKVVEAVKRQMGLPNQAFAANLRSYFFDQPWPGEKGKLAAAQDMFGGEYIWMLERLKNRNAI